MSQLLEKEDYMKLNIYDLMNKAADVIRKREEEKEAILKK